MSLIKHYLHQIMTETQDNIIDRDQLQEAYIESIIDGMDHKSMYQYVYDSLTDSLDKYSVDELITEVEDYYPELLED
jgi:5-formaminoimidazole-4-carboxamide-1-beta-D-ribofuranosyl 5'-monophosphate synthetase